MVMPGQASSSYLLGDATIIYGESGVDDQMTTDDCDSAPRD
jgi:hypothetical protein